jgi:hypothetical protein
MPKVVVSILFLAFVVGPAAFSQQEGGGQQSRLQLSRITGSVLPFRMVGQRYNPGTGSAEISL